VSAFAEAEGEKGAKTRTWFSLPDSELFAVAGLWRDSPEWGPVYAMVTPFCAGLILI
jgi:putative SOS response-associated peptidase YedK